MRMVAVVGFIAMAVGFQQHADARRSKSGFSSGVRADRAPRERSLKGPKQTRKYNKTYGEKRHMSHHPGPKHQDDNYKENGWY